MPEIPDDVWLSTRLSRTMPLPKVACEMVDAMSVVSREYEPGHYLLREGDRPKFCSFLKIGYVFRHKIVGDGGRQIVSIHVPGDLVDVQNILLDHSDHNVQSLTDATMLTVPIDQMLEVAMSHPAVAMALWRETLIETAILREWVTNIGRRDARSRTAHLLCELAVRREAAGLGSCETFELPMTQEQLGDVLGLTAVHVNRTLKSLEADGLISRNKRSVLITDWRGLRGAGDFTLSYLHGNSTIDVPEEIAA